MKKILLHTILFLTLGISSVKAQQNLPAVWTLQDCIEYAKANNISISSLRLSQQSAGQDLVLSKASRLPSLSANVSQSLASTSKGFSPASGYGISSDMVIYNGGFINNDIVQKQLSVQSAGLNVMQQQNDITLQITQAFYNIALAKENLQYVKDLVATSEAQVNRGEELYKAGSIAKKDLLQLQAVLANDQYNLVTAQNTERQYRLNLQQLLQLSSGTAFDIATPDTASTAVQVIPLPQAQQNALTSMPEIANSKLGVDIAELHLEKAKAGSRPTISIGAGINTNYNNTAGYAYPKALGTNLYQQVGITLSIPIFNRKTTQVNVAKAKINIEQANLDVANTKLTLMQQVEQAYLNLVNAQGQYAAASSQLNYSREAFRIANEQLRLGSYNITDYMQQRNLYVQALQSYVQAKYTTSLNEKIYNFYNGVPVTQ
ncbi:MAG TPA: TolC family protein [Chitinophagaceae bacterium]|nr:TolC family protein [Chitinophagaceae bacterium]